MAEKQTPSEATDALDASDERTDEAVAARAVELSARADELRQRASALEAKERELAAERAELERGKRQLLEARTRAAAEARAQESEAQAAESLDVQVNALKLLYAHTKQALSDSQEEMELLRSLALAAQHDVEILASQVREIRGESPVPPDQRDTQVMGFSPSFRLKLWYEANIVPALGSSRRRVALVGVVSLVAVACALAVAHSLRPPRTVEAAMEAVPMAALQPDGSAPAPAAGEAGESSLSLSREQVVDAMRRNGTTALRSCLVEAMGRGELGPGDKTLVLGWTIGEDGSLSAPRLNEPAGLSEPSRSCVTAAMGRWKFPSAAHASIVRNYPLGPIAVK